MSEQVSSELIKAMNEITDNEVTASKIDASIFIRSSEKLVNEKVAYLYNSLKIEAKNCGQKEEKYFEDIELIITHYKQKLNMVYDELYCQYVNIQNELQEARINKRIGIVNYQKLVNSQEAKNPPKNIGELKNEIINKNKIYKDIIDKCISQFDKSKEGFKSMIDEELSLLSESLQAVSERNFFQRIISKISNIFNGSQKFKEILNEYNKMVNKIDSYELAKKMRNNTVEFVADIIELRGVDNNGLEDVRIGGKNGSK